MFNNDETYISNTKEKCTFDGWLGLWGKCTVCGADKSD